MKLFLLMILLSTITSSMSVNYCSRRERELEAVIGLAATCIDLTLCNNGGICPMFYLAVCGCDGQTYGNTCVGKLNGVSTFTPGACPTPAGTPSSAPIRSGALLIPNLTSTPTSTPTTVPTATFKPSRKPTSSPRPSRNPTVSPRPTRKPTVPITSLKN